MESRYYWLKLKKDFFKRKDIQIVEAMPNGKDYVLFYLKLLLEGVETEGSLRLSDTIPYNEDMLSIITNTNIDIVRSAMKVFIQMGMVEILGDETIFMNEVEKMLGSETKWAEKKRVFRQKEDNVLALSSDCPLDVRQEKEKEREIDNIEVLEARKTVAERAESFKNIYNETATELPKVKIITSKRKTAIKKFCDEIGESEWKNVCELANKIPFLKGENDRGWKADMDFLLRTDKAAKVLEGGYTTGKEEDYWKI